ncbi:MAG: tyrosine-type recombinase/integrase [Candidatus Brocadiia bacterium]
MRACWQGHCGAGAADLGPAQPDQELQPGFAVRRTADIPKEDERGRTVDLHALRHTFGTHLSKNGVAPRTAQAALRHSSLDLTMNVYTDPSLLDVAGALKALPELGLSNEEQAKGGGSTRRVSSY